ncbi:MAG TPA: glycosyltransferase [Acidimicrobiales bacterium]|nr:glycosyltransferase [Acidimicrobiales bacterium]
MTSAKGRLAFVTPRYGEGVVGGSESVLREAAQGLVERGWEVDILTTCAIDHHTWANAHPPGEFVIDGVRVRRFPTVHDGDKLMRDTIEGRIQLGLPVTPDEQRLWLNGTFRVPELFHHLLVHSASYRAIVLSPYLFWTTVSCALVAPEKTIVMPCLHDEYYAYLEIVRPLLEDVAQLWFLSEPERDLGRRLVGGGKMAPHAVTGAGLHVFDAGDAAKGRELAGTSRPFVYYGGRREGGKGWFELLGAFTRAVVEYGVDLDLVTTGVGPVEPAVIVADRVHDLGLLSYDDLPHVFAAAAAYVQPSCNESFSRTIMESWLAGTGVIANAGSAVVAWHCERSGAGITYDDPDELVQAMVLVGERPEALRALAPSGREYVLREYTWSVVLDRMEAALEGMPA